MTYKRIASALLVSAFVATLSDAAQRPASGVGTAPVPRPSVVGAQTDSKETSTATITGCVQPGAGPKTYVLAESPSALAPAGAPKAPLPERDRGARYELLSDGTLDLSKLVGRQVEASGTVSKPAVSSKAENSTTRPDALPKFTAKSMRETGASC
jgi:hypothetical protein